MSPAGSLRPPHRVHQVTSPTWCGRHLVVSYCPGGGSSALPISRTSSLAWARDGVVGMGTSAMLDSSIFASGCSAAGGNCDWNQLLVPIPAFGRALPFADGSTSSHDLPSAAPPRLARPSSALLNSLGTIHILLASPWAICGSVCRYW